MFNSDIKNNYIEYGQTLKSLKSITGDLTDKSVLLALTVQNLTPKQIKGIITRVGECTKLVICGDPQQIDNPYINSRTNGLSYAFECMKDSPYCAQITLDSSECVRSKLAEDAANRL